MKKALALLAQFVLFFVVFLAFSLLAPFHMKWNITHPTPTTTHFFVPDGFLLMTVLYLVILGIEAATKRIRTAGILTTAAFAIALILGFASKFGSVSQSLF